MTKLLALLTLAAALVGGVLGMTAVSVVAAKAAPALVESVKAPVAPMDACACGGAVSVSFTYEWCSSPDFVTRTTVYTNGLLVHTTWFDPARC